MAADPDLVRIGVNQRTTSITKRADEPHIRDAVLLALKRMRRYLADVQNAMHGLERALKTKGTVVGTTASRSKKEVRDSILGLVMGMGFIERTVGAQGDQESLAELARIAAVFASAAAVNHPVPPRP
jgi:hypothetical protein